MALLPAGRGVCHDFQQPPDFPMLHRLGIDPFADQLLLSAHMMNQSLYRLGKVHHGAGRGIAGSAIRHQGPQSLDRGVKFCGRCR